MAVSSWVLLAVVASTGKTDFKANWQDLKSRCVYELSRVSSGPGNYYKEAYCENTETGEKIIGKKEVAYVNNVEIAYETPKEREVKEEHYNKGNYKIKKKNGKVFILTVKDK